MRRMTGSLPAGEVVGALPRSQELMSERGIDSMVLKGSTERLATRLSTEAKRQSVLGRAKSLTISASSKGRLRRLGIPQISAARSRLRPPSRSSEGSSFMAGTFFQGYLQVAAVNRRSILSSAVISLLYRLKQSTCRVAVSGPVAQRSQEGKRHNSQPLGLWPLAS